jgi:hypothetical protein|tara:strand:+ start:681 stop:1169 length:489 start_codon:yes stop_codon:yes gene_type:complete
MNTGTYIFKPKSEEISRLVIEAFGHGWLNWENSGTYIRWIDKSNSRKKYLPEGYVLFDIECEGDSSEYTECCWHDYPVEASHLAQDMLVVLDEENFFPLDDNGEKIYNFEDRELAEVIIALSQNNSRIVSPFGSDVWVCEKNNKGKTTSRNVDMTKYLLEEA